MFKIPRSLYHVETTLKMPHYLYHVETMSIQRHSINVDVMGS